MSCRGVLFALTDAQAGRLLAIAGGATSLLSRLQSSFAGRSKRDQALVDFIQETVAGAWDEEWLCETDKAWDAIHRSFSGGPLAFEFDEPLKGVILGGRSLHNADSYIISYKTPDQVKAIAAAVAQVSNGDMCRRYEALSDDNYEPGKSEEDRKYTLEWFGAVRNFYQKAAEANRPVVFTADQ